MTAKKIQQTSNKSHVYRPEIDGLRAFAVIIVIINHFNKDFLPGGYLGVDIFFVISGYVITSSLRGRSNKDFTDFITGFYERRIKRLVPALTVFIAITSLAICLFNPEPRDQLGIAKRALLGFANIALYNQVTDYFAQSTELNAFAHTWSLGVEEQFYVLFPLLTWFSGFTRISKNGDRNLFLLVGGLTSLSLISYLYLYQADQSAAYFLMPSRFWEMAAGCLIFISLRKRASVAQFFAKVPSLLLLALIVGVLYLPISRGATSTMAVVALTSGMIASLRKDTAAFILFTNPKIVYVGLISYSLYLWHWGVLAISRWTIGIHWWTVPAQIALMFLLARASYRWIEEPIRKGSWPGKRWKTLTFGGSVLIIFAGGLTILGKPEQSFIYTGSKSSLEKAKLNGRECIAESYFPACSTNGFTNGDIKQGQLTKRLLIVGDSHAKMHAPLAQTIRERLGYEVGIHSIPGYPFPPNKVIRKKDKASKAKLSYEKQKRSLESSLNILNPGDILIIINSGSYTTDHASIGEFNGFRYPDSQWRGDNQSNFLKRLQTELSSLSKQLHQRGVKIIYFLPTPVFKEYAHEDLCYEPQWFEWLNDKRRDCKQTRLKADIEARHTKTLNRYLEKLKKTPGLLFYNPQETLCTPKECHTIIDSNQMYLDGSHLSPLGSRHIYNSFANFLKKNNLN
tara:strand:+ start:436 stop:2481 length:2046 start_codon:yes stop_codon:yes gene_type:complete